MAFCHKCRAEGEGSIGVGLGFFLWGLLIGFVAKILIVTRFDNELITAYVNGSSKKN